MSVSIVRGGGLSDAAAALASKGLGFIDGAWVVGDGAPFSVVDPSTEQVLADARGLNVAQAEQAIAAARRSFDDGRWATAPGPERAAVLHRLADLMEAHREALVELIVSEVGTPISTARFMQVDMPIANFRWFAEQAALGPRDGWEEALPLLSTPVPVSSVLLREPVGVVAAMTAYNYPLNLLAWKVGGALAAGCTVVLMPSPKATLSTSAFVHLLAEAGLPDGVLNLVGGGHELGELLASDPRVDMFSFTGSDAVGAHLSSLAARTWKKVVLELGGKSPNIVLPGCPPEVVVEPSILRFCRNAGQGCGATTRTFVHRSELERYEDAFVRGMGELVTGDPREEATDVGPVITGEHRDRVLGYLQRAEAAGGQFLIGGGKPVGLNRGYYLEPTLVAGLSNDAELAQQELFGPVGVLLPYDDVDQLVADANATRFGLNANIWGGTAEALAIARRLRSGTVTVNGGGPMRPDVPWGGPGASGVGREMGHEGYREFFEVKHVQWPVDRPF